MKIPAKSAHFSTTLFLKIPRNLTFFPQFTRSQVSSCINGFLLNWSQSRVEKTMEGSSIPCTKSSYLLKNLLYFLLWLLTIII